MTLKQAHRRYPHVPEQIVQWALQNVSDADALYGGLARLEQAIRIQRRFGS